MSGKVVRWWRDSSRKLVAKRYGCGVGMKQGNLVRAIGFPMNRLFVVLETRNERGYEELRLHCSENPFLEQTWSNAEFFEVV